MSNVSLERLVPWRQYTATRSHLYANDHAFYWDVRRHGAALQAAGALVRLRGRLFVDPEVFDAQRVNIEQKAAAS